MRWSPRDIDPDRIALDETDHPAFICSIRTPSGTIVICAEVQEVGGAGLRLSRVHIEGPGANLIGLANLRVLADVVMERLGYDEIEVEGAARTTGAHPGHRPRYRLARRRSSGVP